MFFEKMFGNLFGYIWLLIFLAAVVALMLWVVLKKENKITVNEEKAEDITEEAVVEESTVKETPVIMEEVKTEENKDNNEYEIIESEDGFFRVRRVGNERTLRKFSTRIEAENFIDKKGLK